MGNCFVGKVYENASDSLHGNGLYPAKQRTTGLLVTHNGECMAMGGMTIGVKDLVGLIDGDTVGNNWLNNTVKEQAVVAAADPTDPRIDVVCVKPRITDTYQAGVDVFDVEIIPGTPDASLDLGTISDMNVCARVKPLVPISGYIMIAAVKVAAAATEIAQADIVDCRDYLLDIDGDVMSYVKYLQAAVAQKTSEINTLRVRHDAEMNAVQDRIAALEATGGGGGTSLVSESDVVDWSTDIDAGASSGDYIVDGNKLSLVAAGGGSPTPVVYWNMSDLDNYFPDGGEGGVWLSDHVDTALLPQYKASNMSIEIMSGYYDAGNDKVVLSPMGSNFSSNANWQVYSGEAGKLAKAQAIFSNSMGDGDIVYSYKVKFPTVMSDMANFSCWSNFGLNGMGSNEWLEIYNNASVNLDYDGWNWNLNAQFNTDMSAQGPESAALSSQISNTTTMWESIYRNGPFSDLAGKTCIVKMLITQTGTDGYDQMAVSIYDTVAESYILNDTKSIIPFRLPLKTIVTAMFGGSSPFTDHAEAQMNCQFYGWYANWMAPSEMMEVHSSEFGLGSAVEYTYSAATIITNQLTAPAELVSLVYTLENATKPGDSSIVVSYSVDDGSTWVLWRTFDGTAADKYQLKELGATFASVTNTGLKLKIELNPSTDNSLTPSLRGMVVYTDNVSAQSDLLALASAAKDAADFAAFKAAVTALMP
jgi:hypothetical protein